MKTILRSAAAVLILVSAGLFSATAQQQAYSYYFTTGSFASVPPGGPTLEPIDTVYQKLVTIPATTCANTPTLNLTHFQNNSGFKAKAFFTNTYSIEVIFKFDALDSYQRIIDFSNGASDNGIYTYWNCLNFYPTGDLGTCNFDTLNYNQLVLTRNGSTQSMNVYLNGTLLTTHNDATDYYVVTSDTIKFFRDDNMITNEASSGNVGFIKMSNYELTPAEVALSYDLFCASITSANNSKNKINVDVFPNPASDKLNVFVSADAVSNATLSVVNTLGQIALQLPIENETTSIDISGLSNGVYFYEVETKQGTTTGKVVVER